LYYAFLVGIGSYDQTEKPKVENLPYPEEMIEELYNLLQEEYPQSQISKLNSQNTTTRRKILGTFTKFLESLPSQRKIPKKGEINKPVFLLIYIISHGVRIGNDYYIYPSDVRRELNNSPFRSKVEIETSISINFLKDMLLSVNSDSWDVLFVFDACRAPVSEFLPSQRGII